MRFSCVQIEPQSKHVDLMVSEDTCGHSGARKPGYAFSSLQINLPKLATKKIIQWGEDNIPDDDVYGNADQPQYGREYESHVTVLYGIHDGDPKEIKHLLSKQKPFVIEFGKISVFKCPQFDVAKIEIESIELRRINKIISDNLEVTNANHVFRPHVTIAFLIKGTGDFLVGRDDFVGNRITIDRLTFSSVHGTQTTISLGL
jgi:hypothetical protein